MQYSTNNHLKLMEGTDNVRRQDFVDNFNAIDNGLSKFYVATQSSTNVYKITTGANKTSLQNGYGIRGAIPSASTGAVSVIVDSVTVPVKKPNGSAVTNFKANGVYSLTYYNSVFILASGGGADTVNFSASDLLTGKSANDSNGEKVNGTMADRGAVTATLNCGGSYTIPAGYHNGLGKITANSLASQTSATADASKILNGYTAWVNGSKITGNATLQSLGGKQYATGTTTGFKSYETDTGSPNNYPIACYSIKISVNFTPKVLVVKDSNGKLLTLATEGHSFYYFDTPWSSGSYQNGWRNDFNQTSLNNTNIYIKKIAKYSGSFGNTYNNGEILTWEAWG